VPSRAARRSSRSRRPLSVEISGVFKPRLGPLLRGQFPMRTPMDLALCNSLDAGAAHANNVTTVSTSGAATKVTESAGFFP